MTHTHPSGCTQPCQQHRPRGRRRVRPMHRYIGFPLCIYLQMVMCSAQVCSDHHTIALGVSMCDCWVFQCVTAGCCSALPPRWSDPRSSPSAMEQLPPISTAGSSSRSRPATNCVSLPHQCVTCRPAVKQPWRGACQVPVLQALLGGAARQEEHAGCAGACT